MIKRILNEVTNNDFEYMAGFGTELHDEFIGKLRMVKKGGKKI